MQEKVRASLPPNSLHSGENSALTLKPVPVTYIFFKITVVVLTHIDKKKSFITYCAFAFSDILIDSRNAT